MNDKSNFEVTTLGGGCFWCLDPIFDELTGVEDVIVGYSGDDKEATYQEVCTGLTQHAEVLQVTFDPAVISFEALLKVFFTMHDPTTLNRQGADVGPQYRSVVFYHNDEQKAATEKVINEFESEKIWDNPIVTEVSSFKSFFKAEAYHQKYYENNPNQGYCRAVIAPKVAKFRQKYVAQLKK
ncbi:MAG: peptide-methionine (S)-S-oxide reductase MsrA [Anaerolineales bacterium]|nr:peptide-methionine (S)-S-oxide reductase MsrA [Chloroflexota bacterium]MBL6983954.1 peptide-methionine (S)-S-oxide reductase MsrA [Anaerolineales bacterium]